MELSADCEQAASNSNMFELEQNITTPPPQRDAMTLFTFRMHTGQILNGTETQNIFFKNHIRYMCTTLQQNLHGCYDNDDSPTTSRLTVFGAFCG